MSNKMMNKKIKVEVEIKAQEYEWLEKLGKRLSMTVEELLEQELREKFVELETWRYRFGLLEDVAI